jgi:hypothetical protein
VRRLISTSEFQVGRDPVEPQILPGFLCFVKFASDFYFFFLRFLCRMAAIVFSTLLPLALCPCHLFQRIDGADSQCFEMVEVNRGDGQIFQFRHRRVRAVAQRHGFARPPGGGEQFPGLFADLMIQRHGFQQRNKRVPIIPPALLLAWIFQRLARDVFRHGRVTNEHLMACGDPHLPRSKFRRSPSTSGGSVQKDSHRAWSRAARLAAMSPAVAPSKGVRAR